MTKSFIKEILEKHNPNKCRMSIRIAPDGFSTSIQDTQTKEFVFVEQETGKYAYNDIAKKFDEFVSQRNWIKSDFKAVVVLVEVPNYTLIPKSMYEQGKEKEHLEFNFNLINGELKFNTDEISSIEAMNIYAIPANLFIQIQKHFPKAIIKHTVSSLINTIKHLYNNTFNKQRLFLNVQQNRFDLICFDNKNLQLANSFTFENENDFVYHIVNAIKQLGYQTEKENLMLLGDIEESSILYDKLQKYVRNIQFVSRPNIFKYSDMFNNIASHHHFNLLNALLCE